ncbi:MAG: transglutaminase domain-containing protein [Acidobacteriota bacterium]
MRRAVLAGLVAACGHPAAVPDADRAYALVSTLEIVKPVDLAAMTDDFQDTRLVSETARTITVEVRSYPLAKGPPITGDPQWRRHDLADVRLWPYLMPGPTSNWDDAMRGELIAALRANGIDPDRLDDKQLVEQTSAWLFASGSFRHLNDFIAYYVTFESGQPRVNPALKDEFDEQRASCKLASDEQTIELGVLGKQMFEARVDGDCTASAILETTVMRALGIPTRIIETIPIIDGNDPAQRAQVAALRHAGVRRTIERGVPSNTWANHTYVEVFVGGRWVRLNYSRLGQPPLDRHYFGMMIHVATLRDWGESRLGQSWGEHVFGLGAKLSSQNPYRSLSLHDEIAPGAQLDLSPVKTTTIRRVLVGGEPGLPADASAALAQHHCFVLVTPDVDDDYKDDPVQVSLTAGGQPAILADVQGSITGVSPDIDGYFTCPRAAPQAGVAYRIVPRAPGWRVAGELTYVAR